MSNQTSVIASRYAKALFELSQEQKKLDAVEKDLAVFRERVSSSCAFGAAIANPTISCDAMKQMLKSGLAEEKLHKITQNFIQLLAQNRRLGIVDKIVEAFQARLDAHRYTVVVEVKVAKALSAAQEKELVGSLKKSTGKKDIKLQVEVKEEILGGMVVKVGSTMLDGSLSSRLEGLRRLSKQAVTTL